jgi:hypothetical protein
MPTKKPKRMCAYKRLKGLGWPVAKIARRFKVTRQAVYLALLRHKDKRYKGKTP